MKRGEQFRIVTLERVVAFPYPDRAIVTSGQQKRHVMRVQEIHGSDATVRMSESERKSERELEKE